MITGNLMVAQWSRPVSVPKSQLKPRKRSPRRNKVYNHPRQLSMAVRILDLIEATPGGMTFRQIQKQLVEWSSTRNRPDHVYDPVKDRGFWCTNLYGRSLSGKKGLLPFFCEKKGKRWVRNSVTHQGHPYRVMNPKNPWKASYVQGQYIMQYDAQAIQDLLANVNKGLVP